MELDQSYVWITTRRLKPGTRDEFSKAWRPRAFPDGMLRPTSATAPTGTRSSGWRSGTRTSRGTAFVARDETASGDGTVPGQGTLRPLYRPRTEDPQKTDRPRCSPKKAIRENAGYVAVPAKRDTFRMNTRCRTAPARASVDRPGRCIVRPAAVRNGHQRTRRGLTPSRKRLSYSP
jgi:hypothetical protein